GRSANVPEAGVDDHTGRTIDGYQLEALIGRGSSVDVYRSTHPRLGTPVAVKLFHPEFARDARFAARFRDETRRAAALHHPNIARVFDFGASNDHLYVVEELLPGGSLSDRLA